MKIGYVDLDGVVKDPKKALDKILRSYFYSDTIKHGIPVETYSLRSDMVDGGDVAGNMQKSISRILSTYFATYTVEVTDIGTEGRIRKLELTISVIDDGKTIAIDNVLNTESGALKSIVNNGHL